MTLSTSPPLTERMLHDFAVAWYQALDRHDPLPAVLSLLAPDGLVMVFPETTTVGVDGFAAWYRTVTHRFFDEAHEVRSTDVVSLTPDRAVVTVAVNWRASAWDPPAAASRRLDFDAGQTWTVLAGPAGPVISRYVVDSFVPNAGSATL